MSDGPPRPTREELERYASGLDIDPAVRAVIESDDHWRTVIDDLQRDNTFLSEFVSANASFVRNQSQWLPGDDLPGYSIESELSRGGQGVVFEATQIATKRRVALKMLLQGTFATSRQRHRFEREVELVARIQHPNVVTVYDSGRTLGGAHYLAMEFIDGQPLHEYAAAVRTRSATRDAALRTVMSLTQKICDGITCAHQRGIMHRDLKPGNILVDEHGEPHILDFGLARLEHEEQMHQSLATKGGEFMGTFAYAAPEQLRADPSLLDVRTDVYALGCLLYELVTGERAHDVSGSITEVVQRLQHDDPPPPSTHVPGLDTDVDIIIAKAMAKDPDRRYQSAESMRADIQSWLNNEPIAARRDSTLYVLRKMMRRHRVGLTVAAAFLIVVVGLSAVYTWRLAEENHNLRLVKDIVEEICDPRSLQDDNEKFPSPSQWLTRLASLASMEMPDDSVFEARIRTAAGLAYLDKPDFDAARDQFEQALLIYESQNDHDEEEAALAHHNLGRALWFLGRYEDAEASYRRALAMRVALHPGDHTDVARTLSHIGACLRRLGRLSDAEQMYRRSLAMRIALHGDEHPDVYNSRNSLALCLASMGRSAEAAESFRAVLPFVRQEFGDENFRTARTMHNLAKCLIDLDSFDEADALLADALRMKRAFWGDEPHNDVASTLSEQARLFWRRGDLEDAISAARDAISMQVQVYGEQGHAELATSWRTLGNALLEHGDRDRAAQALRTALDMRRRVLDANAWQIAEIESDYANCLLISDDPQQALTFLEGRDAVFLDHLPPDHLARLRFLERLARTYDALDRQDKAAMVRNLLPASTR